MKLTIAICAYNERRTILDAIRQAQEVELGAGWSQEIIVVDNCSTDGTRELLQSAFPGGRAEGPVPVRVLYHPRNLGKSASILTALQEATGDYFVIFDADLEYEAADLPAMVAAIVPGNTVAVFGSRTLGGRRVYEYAQNYWGVRVLTWLANRLFGGQITDIAVGTKLVRTDVARALNLSDHDFDLDYELPCKLLKRGYEIIEVPVAYHPRTAAQGKGIVGRKAIQVGLRWLWVLLKTRLKG